MRGENRDVRRNTSVGIASQTNLLAGRSTNLKSGPEFVTSPGQSECKVSAVDESIECNAFHEVFRRNFLLTCAHEPTNM